MYHFTDRRNIPLILELGGLYPLAKIAKGGEMRNPRAQANPAEID
jgi:hypothetical protein